MPAARIRLTSFIASGRRVSPMARSTTHSGSAARTASRSLTAVTPMSYPNPASAPASLPTFSGRTHTALSIRTADWRRARSALADRRFRCRRERRGSTRSIAASTGRFQGTIRSSEAPSMSPISMSPSLRRDRIVRNARFCWASTVPARFWRVITEVTCAIGRQFPFASDNNRTRKQS